ncbi:DUF3789 domain-containing protein [Enterococcus faecalis]|nr:DUF3789 domain-containing protein [Enterococcus faecalis]NFA63727.1 DUF3789 domain-containing protein [Enterococcus faecalis]HAP3019614.1 DUF3789 domain-containing protein [Enterococcus faecalis]
MLRLFIDILLVMLGSSAGVIIMCLVQISKQSDEQAERAQRRNVE